MNLADGVNARIPPNTLVIGSAVGHTSGQVLLSLSEADNGTVWYWERADQS